MPYAPAVAEPEPEPELEPASGDPVNVMAVVIERLTRMNAELMAENKALMGAAVTSFAV